MNVIDTLRERGFIEQQTHESELYEYLQNNNARCYIGFDPTASSLHIGSLVPIMALAHMQRHGHRPIALVGGGTGLVGDPSGKTEMRKMITPEVISENVKGIRAQLSRFINFGEQEEGALLLNNADWLAGLHYIDFLRDIGRHFSVNRMVKAESYRMRMDSEEGLSFIEFNYMLLQAYDFLVLNQKYGCQLQMGGSDQWGNIVAGIDLIRRVSQETAFGITFPLITTSSGVKMGKTAQGAVWLDAERTSAYDYYQYWVNTDDQDVARFLSLFTFLPLDEIKEVQGLKGSELNQAKTILAYETTALAHGREQAANVYRSSMQMFGVRSLSERLIPSSAIHQEGAHSDSVSVPQSHISIQQFKKGIPAFILFAKTQLAGSNGAARRLIEQGGGYVNNRRINVFDELITEKDIAAGNIILRAGKKKFHKIIIE